MVLRLLREVRQKIYDKIFLWSSHPWACTFLSLLAFTESFFFPIPPDVMLVPMVASNREKWKKYACICTFFSVLGGFFGFLIGFLLYEEIGKWIVVFYDKESLYFNFSNW